MPVRSRFRPFAVLLLLCGLGGCGLKGPLYLPPPKPHPTPVPHPSTAERPAHVRARR